VQPLVEPVDVASVGRESTLSELEKNHAVLRQYAVLSAAAMWVAREKALEARQKEDDVMVDEPNENGGGAVTVKEPEEMIIPADQRPGCSVGVYLVRSDGYSCQREQVTEGIFRHVHPMTQQLLIMWEEPPRIVFVLKKLGRALLPQLCEAVGLLHQDGAVILVEKTVYRELQEELSARDSPYASIKGAFEESVQEFTPDKNVDLIMCLGGDGVILHASSLFQGPCPPVLGFNLGSMGFLAPHAFTGIKNSMEEAMMLTAPTDGRARGLTGGCDGVPITLRMRLHCELWRDGQVIAGSPSFEVLNELVIDRGPSSFLSMIECYEISHAGEMRLLTKVQADGLIVSTPTGSTAYSVSAGGSMMHPSVPAILVTPICPHSLSFRPVVLPDSATLLLRVPNDARSTAWVCFDGKSRQEVKRGDGIMIKMSEYPMPSINYGDQMSEFVGSLVRCLNWNDREEQKPLEGDTGAMFTKAVF